MRKLSREQKTPSIAVGNDTEPGSLRARCVAYLGWCRGKEYSAFTLDQHRRYLNAFLRWALARKFNRPEEITREVLESYHQSLLVHRKKDGEPLSGTTRKCYLSPIRSWYRWLESNGHIPHDPAANWELPKAGRVLPRDILTSAEVEAVLRGTNVSDSLGLRDRAILETFYSTGMRRRELAGLLHTDLSRDRGTVHIRHGKGRKDRVVPIGSRALGWIDCYERKSRPKLLGANMECDCLFVTHHGEAFTPYRLSQLVSGYVAAAELGKQGSCHLFRHTAATLMLENGCDIRFLQALLGHASLTTTQLYTHVSIARLTEAHRTTHPAECRSGKARRK